MSVGLELDQVVGSSQWEGSCIFHMFTGRGVSPCHLVSRKRTSEPLFVRWSGHLYVGDIFT